MTGYPEVTPRTDFQRRWSEVGLGEAQCHRTSGSLHFREARFSTVSCLPATRELADSARSDDFLLQMIGASYRQPWPFTGIVFLSGPGVPVL